MYHQQHPVAYRPAHLLADPSCSDRSRFHLYRNFDPQDFGINGNYSLAHIHPARQPSYSHHSTSNPSVSSGSVLWSSNDSSSQASLHYCRHPTAGSVTTHVPHVTIKSTDEQDTNMSRPINPMMSIPHKQSQSHQHPPDCVVEGRTTAADPFHHCRNTASPRPIGSNLRTSVGHMSVTDLAEGCRPSDRSHTDLHPAPGKRHPPPPPPRSGSWLGRSNALSSSGHLRYSVSGPTQSPQPARDDCSSYADLRHTQPVQQLSPNVSPQWNLTESKPHRAEEETGHLRAPHSSVKSAISLANSSFGCVSVSVTSNGQTAVTVAHSSSAVLSTSVGSTRLTITDTLLRLLICHYTTVSSTEIGNSSVQQEKDTLDRLLQAVCGVQHDETNGRFVDNDVASLARLILPHLVRIIYTELSSEGSNSPVTNTNGRPYKVTSVGHTGCVSHPSNPICSTQPEMTSSSESRPSYTEEDDLEDEDDGDEEADSGTMLDVLEDGNLPSKHTSELDSLPPGTSISDLKNAATEAIQRLISVCQADSNLRERDLGIVQLLTTIHRYSTAQHIRLCRSRCFPQSPEQSDDPKYSASFPLCPVAEVAALVRLSFYPEHRSAICDMGGVHALVELLRTEQSVWTELLRPIDESGSSSMPHRFPPQSVNPQSAERSDFETSVTLRRYICMALTNLTYGVAANKALLCRRMVNLEAVLAQLEIGNEELKQVAASVLRNLCWRTDSRSKLALRRVNAPRRLTLAAMSAKRESTLRTALSALWNLSSHCFHNKRAVCSVDGVFGFLLGNMHCNDLTNRLVIIENSGGILRNISVVAAGRDDYRSQLHQNKCYSVLFELLRNAPSLTAIVNVCGTLWNLTASPNCPSSDLAILCRSDFVDLLHQLSRSSHELVRNSSTSVLRNLLHPQTQSASTNKSPFNEEHVVVTTSFPNPDANQSNFSNEDQSTSLQWPTEPPAFQPNPVVLGNSPVQSDQPCRRRFNSRSHLHFGLLSVVLEAEYSDEEEAAVETEDEVEDENDETCADEVSRESDGSIYPNQESLVTDDSSVALDTLPASDPNRNSSQCQPHPSFSNWNGIEHDEDQTCIYAEEGTPFPPDSGTTSCPDLHRSPHAQVNRDDVLTTSCCVSAQAYYSAGHPLDELDEYTSAEALPHVYAVEGTPQMDSGSPSAIGGSPQCGFLFHPNHEKPQQLLSGNAAVDEEISQLPSPPPDVSSFISSHLSPHRSDAEATGNLGFPLPPPPPTCCSADRIPVADHTFSPINSNINNSSVSSHLIFPRGTSSCLSPSSVNTVSLDLPFSPRSECSVNQIPVHLAVDFADDVSSCPDGKVIFSPPDSAVNEEELLVPLNFSQNDGVDEGNVGEEMRLSFAEEGTPQDALSLVGDSQLGFATPSKDFDLTSGQHSRYACWSHSNNHKTAHDQVCLVEDGDDEDEHGQSFILQECIASAMPSSRSFSLHPGIAAAVLQYSAAPPENTLFATAEDCVQSFAVEDTPFGTSTKTSSVSDLYILDHKGLVKNSHDSPPSSTSSSLSEPLGNPMLIASHQYRHNICSGERFCDSSESIARVSSSNSSSINGDTSSDLLSEVIQSAMPKSTQSTVTASCSGPTDLECVQLYALEGTPGEDDPSETSCTQKQDSGEHNSITPQISLHCPQTTSPVATIAFPLSSDIGTSMPPAPPRRTTSALSNQKDFFGSNVVTINRPQATVAPMPQVVPSTAAVEESVDNHNSNKPVSTRESVATGPTDKDDASSFSSLLSIESVGLEHSLLQECISSAMPHSKLSNTARKNFAWHPVRMDSPSAIKQLTVDRKELSEGSHNSLPISKRGLSLNYDSRSLPLAAFSAPFTQAPSSVDSGDSSPGRNSAPANISHTVASNRPHSQLASPALVKSLVKYPVSKTLDSNKSFLPTSSNPKGSLSSNKSHLNVGVVPPHEQRNPHSTSNVRTGLISDQANNSACSLPTISHLLVVGSRLPSPGHVLRKSSVPVKPVIRNGCSTESVSTTQYLLAESTQAVLAALTLDDVETDSAKVMNNSRPSADQNCAPPAQTNQLQPDRSSSSAGRLQLPSPLRDLTAPSNIPSHRASSIPKPPSVSHTVMKQSGSVSTHGSPAKLKLITPSIKYPKAYQSASESPSTNRCQIQSQSPRSRCVSGSPEPSFGRLHVRQSSANSFSYRTALTCPPSATGRSLTSSRSTSASGSQNNLHQSARVSQPVSAKSVCAALSKQERHTISSKKPGVGSTSIDSQSKSHQYRYQTAGAKCNSSIKSLSSSATHLSDTQIPPSLLQFDFPSVHEPTIGDDDPKPIRGGRKSLTGRKPATCHTKSQPTVGKPVIRPDSTQRLPDKPATPQLGPVRIPTSALPICDSSRVQSNLTSSNSGNCQIGSKNEPDSGMWIVRGQLPEVEQVI